MGFQSEPYLKQNKPYKANEQRQGNGQRYRKSRCLFIRYLSKTKPAAADLIRLEIFKNTFKQTIPSIMREMRENNLKSGSGIYLLPHYG